MIRNGFYYCTKTDSIYHQTDEGMDMLLGWFFGDFYDWFGTYDQSFLPVTQEEIDEETMIFLGE